MPRRLPPLNSLRAFEASARHLSFTRAAEELFVTQAAVSHQIKSLEEFLGVPLFIRKNRKLLLTDEGQEYWPKIRDIFEKLALATEQLKALGASGPLTVSVVPTFAIVWLVPRLSRFSQLYPDIDVRLKAVDRTVDFLQEDVDIAIYYEKGDYGPGLYSETLLHEFLTPVCSPSLLDGDLPLNEPQDLKQHTLLHDASTDEWRAWLKLAGVKGADLRHGPVFSHSSMVIQAAIHGQGVALGHNVLSKPDIQANRLIRPFDIVLPSDYKYDLVCPEESAERPKVKAFRDWITELVASEEALESLF
ncbi:transcriptional regulator GcvA [Pleionea sp. CnH1-48]|uniref:transcriptional regulator GcvA n=1 Tax=Pleionea sp. CnH1-48 TaxID=2954494 RepID=UPI0020975981|nr:transcriptional regulator GcvA [Pleionea sp. CnH1-48]MCO7226787.1 transcriptional regulator GcvA [Pleionea sp. CnH1-48]